MRKRKTLKRKSWRHWQCYERGICCLPFTWHRLSGNSVPLDGHFVLVATWSHEGKILKVPKGEVGDTFAFLGKHDTRWWSYLPAIPAIRDKSGKVLTIEDFFDNTKWTLGK